MSIFDGAVSKVFINRSVFSKTYIPKTIPHRDAEITSVANCLKYALQNEPPADCIIYGKRGTGKTLIARHVTDELCKLASVKVFHVSLKNARTEFRAMEKIIDKLTSQKITGISFNAAIAQMYDFIKGLNEKYIVMILDEINDVDAPDVLLHSLLRSNEIYGDLGGKELSYIFITNDLNFPQNLSPGTKSTFTGVTKRVFSPYNAVQLRDILKERVNEGLRSGVCDEGIIALCAAYGAQELGDARETIKLLEKSAEITDEKGEHKITDQHVKEARQQIEFEGAASVLKSLPPQLKALALACARDQKHQHDQARTSMTGTVYQEYRTVCIKSGLDVLTQRRMTDLVSELEALGIIEAQLIYKRGKTRHIFLLTPGETIEKTVLEDYRFEALRPEMVQTKLG